VQLRLHRGGRFRGWLGARLGGDAALGDRAWRRVLHLLGALVLLYYVLPDRVFVVASTEQVLFVALALVAALELLRHLVGLELPTVRPLERGRPASFLYFAVGLVAAVVLFPRPIGAAVALGTAWVDPLIGELRRSVRGRSLYPAVPLAAYATIATVVFALAAPAWHPIEVAGLAALAAAIAVAVERPKHRLLDDDLVMTIAPAVVLLAATALWPAGY
jgi:dolichol kinase